MESSGPVVAVAVIIAAGCAVALFAAIFVLGVWRALDIAADVLERFSEHRGL